jgi:hypothetical protein
MKARVERFGAHLSWLVVLAAASGCKSESSAPAAAGAASSTTSNAGAATGEGPCTVVTPAEAAATLGVPTFGAPEVSAAPPVTICEFPDAKHGPALTLRFETGRTLQDFATIRKVHDSMGQKTVDYPGLGDAAATFTLGPIAAITFLHKGTVIMLEGSHLLPDRLAALARTIASRR